MAPLLQDLLPFLPELNVLDLLGQHDWRLKQFFRDPRLRAMFTFQVPPCAVCAVCAVWRAAGSRALSWLPAAGCWQVGGRLATCTCRAPAVSDPGAGAELCRCLLAQDLYVGLTPYSAPAVFGLLAGTELTDGVWYPLGGFQKVCMGMPRVAWEVRRLLARPACQLAEPAAAR